jgi:type I restriction enzyme M protein
MVALPTQLFRSTGIPVCVWFFAKDKGKRVGEVLFIDARKLGHMVDRAERALRDEDISEIASTYHSWLGINSTVASTPYADIPGFAYSATLAEIKSAGYALTPGRYVGMPEVVHDETPIEERLVQLRTELERNFSESARLAEVVRHQLGRLDV